jgi:hypothetical protein
MSWHTTKVIAAYAPRITGSVISQPIVRDKQKHVFVVRDVSVGEPIPNTLIDEEELRSGAIESIVMVPECPAKCGFLTVVISKDFAKALEKSNISQNLSWVPIVGTSFKFAYDSIERIDVWRNDCAKAFMAWTKGKLPNALRESIYADREARQIEDVLRQVRYITDNNSVFRKEMYLQLGVLLTIRDPQRWKVVEDLALRELGVDKVSLDEELKRYREILNCEPPELFSSEAARKRREPIHYFQRRLSFART